MLRRIEDHVSIARCARGGAALCTIVKLEGSFSRRLGAQLAIGRDGGIVGSLADGCIETQLRKEVERLGKSGTPEVFRFGNGSTMIDFRLPCGSGLEILVDPAPNADSCAQVVAQLDQRLAGQLELPKIGSTLRLRTRRYIPPPRVIVLGTGPEVKSLKLLAYHFGLDVEVHEPFRDGKGLTLGKAPAAINCDPWTAIVLLFHDHEWENTLLKWALNTPAFYIGAQGGKVVRENRSSALLSDGADVMAISRIHSPIGLISRTRDPHMLALSVFAEIMAEYEALHPHK